MFIMNGPYKLAIPINIGLSILKVIVEVDEVLPICVTEEDVLNQEFSKNNIFKGFYILCVDGSNSYYL